MGELDLSQPSWPYDLAWLFLNAAQCCDFECDRIYVSDGTLVESMPPGCSCQLVAVVDARWQPTGVNTWMLDRPRKVATVNLILELCVVVPDAQSVPDPKTVTLSARESITKRWQIMQGLETARAAENLGGEGCTITPAGWVGVSQTGGVARWQTSWGFTTE